MCSSFHRARNGRYFFLPFKNFPPFRCRSITYNAKHSESQLNDVISQNKKITSLIRSGNLDSAIEVFKRMSFRTTITWNSILAGFSKMPGRIKDARELFASMPEPDTVSYNIMMACLINNGGLEEAKDLFDSMPGKDVASWNTMITGFSRNGMMRQARDLFLAMPRKNSVSWNAVISGYVESGDLDRALELFRENPTNDVIAYTAILTGFMKSGKVEMAEMVFQEAPARNVVTWNTMIAGYVENGRSEEALKLFRTMVELGIKVNPSSLSSILLGCSNLSSLKMGRQVHQHVVKSPLYLDTTVGTSLISMYSKCGELEESWKLFVEMPERDVITWNAMISGYAQHGAGQKALNLFDEMQKKGMKPESITFLAVLSACNHAGFVELGMKYFEEMQKVYGVEPRSDHYACLVDLLSRAGNLEAAMDMIKKMPCKPHISVYGVLLGACRSMKNLEVAEFAARNMRVLDPTNATGLIQLANFYAATKMWDEVSRIRRTMKENRVVKTPGYSWMEVGNSVHEFRSGDRIHPELDKIHVKLDELEKKMKLAGYVPHFESDLHCLGEMQKGEILLCHSEKLAIAYGLLKLPENVPIRVFKNLRVCNDCHRATKFISAIERREIIVRDTRRFHHFRNGMCSCGDYW